MNNIILSILLAVVSTFIAIYALRPFALRTNLLDIPKGRKNHEGNVPLIGGLAMYCAVVFSILVTQTTFTHLNYFLLVTGILIIIGALDDHKDISVLFRIISQALLSILFVAFTGVHIESLGSLLGSGDIFLNEWSYFVAIIAIIGAMNAVNMTDGINGMAGANSLITFLALLYLSIENISNEYVLLIATFCAVIMVFLVFNLCIGISKSKRIFLGDAGSMFIGFTIALLLIVMSQGEGRAFAPVTALWLFGPQLIEIGSVIFRRLLLAKSPFKPDLLHTHYILIGLGLSEKNTLFVLSFFSLLMATTGVLSELYLVAEFVMFVVFLLIFLIHVLCCFLITNKSNSGLVNQKQQY